MLLNLKSKPSPSMQRWFGASLGALFLILGWMLHLGPVWRILLFLLAAAVPLVYYLVPTTQVPIIRGWQVVTYPIAFVVSHLLLAATFYLIFLPIGFVLRLTGYDPLQLRNWNDQSAWQSREKPADVKRYFKQF